MISRFFINRPIFASVISIIIVISGLISIKFLPVSQYPDILPTIITVTAHYPGASAETIANSVAAPLEQQINGVENMVYMNSNSSNNGQLSITITFGPNVDPAQAEIDVNNRAQSALKSLPEEVQKAGINVSRKSSSILEVIALYSPDNSYDSLYMGNYALLSILDELKRVEGVGDASLFGGLNYSMRIWLKPDKMAYHNITYKEIVKAVQEQNSQWALGKLGSEPQGEPTDFTYIMNTGGRLTSASEFEDIIIKSNENGSSLRIKDVARVELGSENYDFVSKLDGKPAVALGIYLQTGANALNTTEYVNKRIAELSTKFPEGIKYSIPFDTTTFVRVSIHEVIKTFIEAIFLVSLVVFIFLQNIRATIIPLIAVPVSLIGTFAGLYLGGFSINLLTLFGLILSIGIVVDDAIIVIENVERIMREKKLAAKAATILAMEEVSGPVIAIILVLTAVFIPIMFVTGIAGIIYKQFAVTIVIAVILSGIVALTLTPALCANFLKDEHSPENSFFQKFNSSFSKLTNFYVSGVDYFLNHIKFSIIIFAILICSILYLNNKLPKSLVPEEDQGYVVSAQMLMPASSLDRTIKVVDRFTEEIINDPSVDHIISLAGIDLIGGSGLSTNSGVAFIKFKDWDLRKSESQSSVALANKFMGIGAKTILDGIVLAFNPPAITGMSTTGGFDAYIQYNGSDKNYLNLLNDITNKILEKARTQPELINVRTSFANNIPLYEVKINKERVKALNVNINDVFNTMQASFGTYYVNDFSLNNRTYRVYMQSDSDYRRNPDDLAKVYVKSNDNNLISLASLVDIKPSFGLASLDRFNIFPSSHIMGSAKAGFSSGQALDSIERVAKEILPEDFSLAWTGSSYQEKISSKSGYESFIIAIIMVFLILAALYERWSLPIAVIASVPFAVFGALIFQYLRGLTNDVYFQVGLITLIGLSAKNAILIVEFAIIEYKKGTDLRKATILAAKMRFRPIIMTSLAFILGCVPLYFSSGAGAASRHSIGTGIIGGMLSATFIAIFFIPLFFKLIHTVNFSSSKESYINE